MINKKSWDEFQECGLLWWINMILHTFGWAICYEYNEDGSITNVYPSRVKFRGVSEKINTDGYMRVSQYLSINANKLFKESLE